MRADIREPARPRTTERSPAVARAPALRGRRTAPDSAGIPDGRGGMIVPERRRAMSRGLRGVLRAAAGVVSMALMAACGGSAGAPATATAPAAAPASSTAAAGPVAITFWTAYTGPLGSDLQHLIDQFNASQSRYKVTAVYKGTYPQVLADTIAAYRSHQAPAITMIFDVGTATMMDSQGVYVPVHKLMADNGIPFATSDFVGAAASYYETADGQLDSLPFASSTPVLYYNKAMLASIHAQPPATWQQMGTVGEELVRSGVKYGFTIGWPDWTQFEQYAVWNDYPYATDDNGYTAIKGVRLLINTPPFVRHIDQLAQWQKTGVFYYGGRESTPEPLFLSGKAGMYIDSSASYAAIAKGAKFDFGVAPLPYEDGDPNAPQNTVVGGNSLWVMAGQPANVYPGVAQFLHFLMSGPSQAYWAANTGYVPITTAGVTELTRQGFYQKNPYAMVAVRELTNKPALPSTRGIRLGNLAQIRDIENAAITAVFAGRETAQQALDAAEQQGNAVLDKFASGY
jgi:sn-glycerol 3-phosphate transport system substrate-binding protein